MASELRVNTLKDASGNNSIGMSYVAQSPKAWIAYNGTGTIAIADSFNIASLTVIGTGAHNTTFTNSMNNADFSSTGAAGELDDAGGNRSYGNRNKSTSGQNCRGFRDGVSTDDFPEMCFHTMGDLA